MKKGIGLLCSILCIIFFAGCSVANPDGKEDSTNKEVSSDTRDIFAMDTYMSLTAWGDNAKEALDEAEEEIKRLEKLLSAEISDSEIYIVNKNGSIVLSEDTANLIQGSIDLYQSTEGAFDITIYPLMVEWGFTSENYHIPEKSQIQKLLKNVDTAKLEYDKTKQLLSLPEGIEIDLGGIAKGYTSSRIMEIFKKYDILSGMVSLGGNVQVYKSKVDGSPFKVAIESPDDQGDYVGVLQVKDQAVITSGGYERYFEKDGQTWHHILDPKTGYPARSGLTSVTIVSEDGMKADGLSTSLFVMGKEKALSYWKKHKEKFDAILVEEDGSVTITEGLEGIFSSERKTNVEK